MNRSIIIVGAAGLILGVVVGYLISSSQPQKNETEEVNLTVTAETATMLQAREYVIPIVDFEEASIHEGVEYLRGQTRRGIEVDGIARPEPLNFLVIDPDNRAGLLSLRLRDIRLDHLCERIAQVAGLEVSFDQDVIVFKASGKKPTSR